jgi:hypothetical protein
MMARVCTPPPTLGKRAREPKRKPDSQSDA